MIEAWSKVTAAERSKCLRKWYDLLMSHKEELGQLMTLEQGKPLKEAIGEVPWFSIPALPITALCSEYLSLESIYKLCDLQVGYGASFVEFFAEEAKRVYGDIIPATLPDRRLFVVKQVKVLE